MEREKRERKKEKDATRKLHKINMHRNRQTHTCTRTHTFIHTKASTKQICHNISANKANDQTETYLKQDHMLLSSSPFALSVLSCFC